MVKIYEVLFGNKRADSFEERVVNISLFFAVLLSAIGLIYDILMEPYFVVDRTFVVNVLFLACWVLTYLFKARYRWVVPVGYCILVFVLLPYYWIMTNGIFGSMPYYCVISMVIFSLATKGKLRYILMCSVLLVIAILVGYDAFRMDGYAMDVFISFGFQLLLATGAIGIILTAYSKVYIEEKKRSMAYAEAIKEQNRYQEYYMKSLEEMNEKLKGERHEFNNHLGVIHGLMEMEDYDGIREYTGTLVTSAESYRTLVNVPYPTIRAMLNYKLGSAQKKGIHLKVKAAIPKGLNLNEFDFGMVLGNLIDNGIEALMQVDVSERMLSLDISYKPDYLILRIENPYEGHVISDGDRLISTKKEEAYHGFGLRNVRKIVDKYQGIMEIDYGDDLFRVHLGIMVLMS